MSIDPKLKEKIQKLLALGGNNDNQHEADLALKKAAKLAEECGLALSDVDEISGKVKSVKREDIVIQKENQQWLIILSLGIAKAFECEVISSVTKSSATNFQKKKSLVFLGTPTDLDLAVWYFKFLKIQIMRQAEAKFKKVLDQKTFSLGAVQALRVRLHEMFEKPRQDARSEGVRALVVIKNTAIKDELAAQFGKLKSNRIKTGKLSSNGAYVAGQEAGRRMELHRGHLSATAA